MYITNTDEVIPILKTRLNDYLVMKGVKEPHEKKFLCFIHGEDTPSMVMNPKTAYQTAHCFGCNTSIDVFAAAAHLEGLPESGNEWMTVTIPKLAEMLNVPIEVGEPGPQDIERLRLYKIASDIDEIISRPQYQNTEYTEKRGWKNEIETYGSISCDSLMAELINKGWSSTDITTTMMIRTKKHKFFSEDYITFTVRNSRGQPIGFISRNLTDTGAKYINTTENLIFEKRKTLLGLDVALKAAKYNGLYIVEGPGDRAQLLRLGIKNVVATMGVAFTPEHASTLRMHGIKDVFFCLDWDNAGLIATNRIFDETLRSSSGLSCWVVEPPGDMGDNTDPDAYMKDATDPKKFTDLEKTSAFEWVMKNTTDHDNPGEVCNRMVPIIASETTAVKREILINQLVEFTGISHQAIAADVATIRDSKHEQRKDRLLAAAERYRQEVERDPDNIIAAMAQHEYDIECIEKDYEKQLIGTAYQLARYDAIQELKKPSKDGIDRTCFQMNYFTDLADVLSGGMIYTVGTVIYFGGRANSGKTATVIMVGLDVALSDPDTIVLMHYTDDPLQLIEPRLKTNISMLINGQRKRNLHIGQAANPWKNIHRPEDSALYNEADHKLRELLIEERLVLIDSEEGATLSTLERYLRYLRRKYPEKKILIICDNTYNYMDYGHLQPTDRIQQIANAQKNLTIKYHACMMATAEYRKNQPLDNSRLKLPVNDDLADSRAMMYRSNGIIHVYNDLKDRGDCAEFFWVDPAEPDNPKPRLLLVFGKNKITKFDRTLYVDLEPDSVTLQQVDIDRVKKEYQNYTNTENGTTIIGGRLIVDATEWEQE